jgi:hypothetical protein
MIIRHGCAPFIPPVGLLAARALLNERELVRRSIAYRPTPTRTQRYLIARRANGNAAWVGFFKTHADSQRFLKAIANGTLPLQPGLWDLPTPAWAPGLGSDAAYEFSTTVTSTGAGNVTSPANSYKVDVEAWGGGGSGNATTTAGVLGAGGGGAYAGSFGISVTAGSTIVYWVVGTGGAQVTNNQSAATGVASWINVGTNSSPSSSANGAAAPAGHGAGLGGGGAGGTPTIGGTLSDGSSGATGTSGNGGTAGQSADSIGGSGGATATTGVVGNVPGGGGGGAHSTTQHSGAGAAGQIRYTFYIQPVVTTNLAMMGM